jgi:Spy/CpxP family protein refolding chaperone
MLFRAHPEALKAKLGLDEQQVSKIRGIRQEFWIKKVQLKADMAKHGVKLRILGEEDLPDEAKLLAAMKQKHAAKWKLKSAKVATGLKLMRVLTAEQRATLRKMCRMRMMGRFGHPRGPGGKFHGPERRSSVSPDASGDARASSVP